MATRKTLRDALDLMADTLEAQGGYSADGTQCRYRDQQGRKCAVGALIPDYRYDASWDADRLAVSARRVQDGLHAAGWSTSKKSIAFYRAAQALHDEGALRELATATTANAIRTLDTLFDSCGVDAEHGPADVLLYLADEDEDRRGPLFALCTACHVGGIVRGERLIERPRY